jgi:hypothetical protein
VIVLRVEAQDWFQFRHHGQDPGVGQAVERRYVLVGAIGQHPVNDRFLVGLAFCDSLDVVRQFGYCLGKLHK